MKKIKIFAIELIIMFVIIATYNLIAFMLKPKGLTFTNNVNMPYTILLIIFTLVMFIQVIVFLYRIAKNKALVRLIRIPSGIGCAVIALLLAVSLLFLPYFWVFGFEPEHFVTKDGKQMAAYVNSFLQVEVDYYDYKNLFVRGSKLKIREDYGNGGYDPFEQDKMPKVKRYAYYDDNGNIMKSNWLP